MRGRTEILQSVSVFRQAVRGEQDIVAGKVEVLPAERRQVSKQVMGDVFRVAGDGHGTFEVPGVPQDDRGNGESQPGSTVLDRCQSHGRAWGPVAAEPKVPLAEGRHLPMH